MFQYRDLQPVAKNLLVGLGLLLAVVGNAGCALSYADGT